jgi:hypothetical protein
MIGLRGANNSHFQWSRYLVAGYRERLGILPGTILSRQQMMHAMNYGGIISTRIEKNVLIQEGIAQSCRS